MSDSRQPTERREHVAEQVCQHVWRYAKECLLCRVQEQVAAPAAPPAYHLQFPRAVEEVEGRAFWLEHLPELLDAYAAHRTAELERENKRLRDANANWEFTDQQRAAEWIKASEQERKTHQLREAELERQLAQAYGDDFKDYERLARLLEEYDTAMGTDRDFAKGFARMMRQAELRAESAEQRVAELERQLHEAKVERQKWAAEYIRDMAFTIAGINVPETNDPRSAENAVSGLIKASATDRCEQYARAESAERERDAAREKVEELRRGLAKFGMHAKHECLYEPVTEKGQITGWRHRGKITECPCGLAALLAGEGE